MRLPFPYPWHLRARVWLASAVMTLLVPHEAFVFGCRIVVAADDAKNAAKREEQA